MIDSLFIIPKNISIIFRTSAGLYAINKIKHNDNNSPRNNAVNKLLGPSGIFGNCYNEYELCLDLFISFDSTFSTQDYVTKVGVYNYFDFKDFTYKENKIIDNTGVSYDVENFDYDKIIEFDNDIFYQDTNNLDLNNIFLFNDKVKTDNKIIHILNKNKGQNIQSYEYPISKLSTIIVKIVKYQNKIVENEIKKQYPNDNLTDFNYYDLANNNYNDKQEIYQKIYDEYCPRIKLDVISCRSCMEEKQNELYERLQCIYQEKYIPGLRKLPSLASMSFQEDIKKLV